MSGRPAPGAPLGEAAAAGALFAAWCAEGGDGPSAAAELAAAAAGPGEPAGPAPWFASTEAAAWAAELASDLPDAAARERLAADLDALRRGAAEVVVTGQQPGFLGGPLYTLHKIATAVALARRLTAAGRPAVPVFWSGDDDDDLAEACAAAAPAGPDALVRSELRDAARHGRVSRRRVGTLPAGEGQDNGAAWLEAAAVAGGPSAAGVLAETWRRARDEGWSWARLQRRALLTVFAGTGLLVVSGDDARLHRAAAPLYARTADAGEALGDALAARGRELEAAGWHAQLARRAAERPLYTVDGDRRRPLEAALPADTGTLRPGVMLRSPVQDWLLRPAAVVVGPAEHAYLRQLTGVYAVLELPRAPLVPRLFAWLLPEGFARNLLDRLRAPAGPDPESLAAAWTRWEDETAAAARRLLIAGGLPAPRAAELAAGRARRWRRGLARTLVNEQAARAREARPTRPAWVFPEGGRQERLLAWAAAGALWGDELVAAVLEAASRHLEHGAAGDWREWEITVPAPEDLR